MLIINTKDEFEKLVKQPRKYLKYAKANNLKIEYQYEPEYEALVKAVFIKNRKERITYIYDNACERIDKYNEDNGLICKFKETGRCEGANYEGRINGCCYRCIYQSEKGCPSKNLTCKFYFCKKLRELNVLKFEDFPEFKLLTKLQQEIVRNNPYCKRESFLRLLFLNSYIVFYIFSTRNALNMTIGELKNRKLEKRVKIE